MKIQIKAVGFDWDGTLVDNSHLIYEVLCHQIEAGLGKPPSEVEFLETYEPPHMDYLRRHGSNILDQTGWDIWTQVYAGTKPVTLQEGSSALVERFLRTKVDCFIVTANRVDTVHSQLKKFHMASFFSGVYASMEHKEVGIASILKSRGISNPQQMFYLGDMRQDMYAAKKTGVVGVGIASMKGFEQEHARVLLEAGAAVTFPSLTAFHDALIRGDL